MFGFFKKDKYNFDVDRTATVIHDKVSDTKFIELEIKRWKESPQRKAMLEGERYYNGEHDILKRKRTVIGKDGKLVEVSNLPNNRIIDNKYSDMVDQKVNYLFGKPFTFNSDNEQYTEYLQEIFTNRFFRTFKNMAQNTLNCGIGWIYPYYNDKGILCFSRFEPFEILPFWKDSEHTTLDFAVRLYEVEVYEGNYCKVKEKVEVYYSDRIEKYDYNDGILTPDKTSPVENYITLENENDVNSYSWGVVPLVAFRYNHREIPLIRKVKGLQDGINAMLSDFQNNMEEDSRNTVLIIKNYDGQNLAEFRHNLATYGAVKVKTIDGSEGGVEALKIDVNAENYRSILELLKKSLIENAKGYDAKDDRLSGNPNQMNIQSMYSDIDLDANQMETEFQSSLEQLMELVHIHMIDSGMGDFTKEKLDFVFNRSVMINNSELIENCIKSTGLLSEKTILAQHPWIHDAMEEIERKKEEIEENLEYANAFPQVNGNGEQNDQE